ncbi:HEAT repeat domain-containing protein [Crocosphaera sp. Alani8]
MIYYRLPLLILICLSYLTCPSPSLANSDLLTLDEIGKKEKKIAQADNPSDINSTPSFNSDYDLAMQAGYEATEQKDYEVAQKEFKKALQARPNDIYARQALQNVEFYIARQSNPFRKLTSNNTILWVGLIIIIAAIGILAWRFLSRGSAYSREELEEELLQPQKFDHLESNLKNSQNLDPVTTKNHDENNENQKQHQNSLFSTDKKPVELDTSSEVMIETPDSEKVLAIQKTTRIPSGDQVENLIKQLQENEPKKRRQAIWKLAQTADSRAMKPLVDLMIDTDSQERSLILEALSQISTRTLKPMNHALTLSLQDKNPQVRKNAIRDLTRIHELMSQIYQLLCHAIDDSDQEVQETAKWAINQLNTQIPPRLDLMTGENISEVAVEQSYSDAME